jgi:hypothetical protein
VWFAHIAGVPVEETLAAVPGIVALSVGAAWHVRAKLTALANRRKHEREAAQEPER